MANCIYCGKPAGLLRKKHKECSEKVEKVSTAVIGYCSKFIESKMVGNVFAERVVQIFDHAKIPPQVRAEIIDKGLGTLVSQALDDGILTTLEENRIMEFANGFKFQLQQKSPALAEKLVKAAIIRDLSEFKTPNRTRIENAIPVLIPSNEPVIWLFNDVTYWEQKTRTQYVGGSSGVSFRVAKGVYVRAGAHKGERIQTTEMHPVTSGILVVTSKNIYFHGNGKALKIAIKKLISIEGMEDAIKIYKDGANPKPQIFQLDDPWFAENVLNQLV